MTQQSVRVLYDPAPLLARSTRDIIGTSRYPWEGILETARQSGVTLRALDVTRRIRPCEGHIALPIASGWSAGPPDVLITTPGIAAL